MRRRNVWFILVAVLIVLVLTVCGCGKKKEEVTPATTEAKEASKDETKTETKEATKEEPADDQDGQDYDGPSEAQCMQITMTLLDKLQQVTIIGAGQVRSDPNVAYEDPEYGFTYYLVTDANVQSFYDIYQMLYNNFTEGCIDARWKYLVEPTPGTAPYYQLVQEDDLPTGIYVNHDAGTGYMTYTPTGDIEIEQLDDRHFYATVPFQAYGETLHLTMDIILEDDWKINGFSVE